MLLLTQNYLDTMVIAYVLLSALLGFMRGFYRELFRAIAWTAAFVVTYFILPRFARALPLASVVTSYLIGGSILFFLLLSILSLVLRLVHSLLDLARILTFGDRLVGLALGVTRGFFVFCFVYLVMTLVPSINEPEIVRTARFRPFIISGAEFVRSVLEKVVSPQFMPKYQLRTGSLEQGEKQKLVTQNFNGISIPRMNL